MSRRRKKKDSPIKSVFLIIMAAIIMMAAVYVIMSVVGKIRSDYKNLDFTTEEKEMPSITIDTKDEPKAGWNETAKGWMYYLDEKEYVTDQWKDIEGFLYYFDSDGIMATGELKQEGQTYTCHDTKGYLKNIQIDPDYVPESTGENLDSLVRTNAFWCYLRTEDTGLFKTILYRKTVENKVVVLGGESAPEKTTRNSMRAYGDYVYFLPKVKESQKQGLSEAERGLCDKLFRMRPGSDTKELIAENVDGYMVLGDIIYYSQAGKIYQATSGTEVATGEARYSVVIKDGNCYLVDGMGNPAVAESGSSVSIGDRVYRIEEDGKIKYVKHGQVAVDGKTYYLGGSGTKAMGAILLLLWKIMVYKAIVLWITRSTTAVMWIKVPAESGTARFLKLIWTGRINRQCQSVSLVLCRICTTMKTRARYSGNTILLSGNRLMEPLL